jgi:cytoskeleton protein RodZ
MVWSERRRARGMAREGGVAAFGEQLRREREQRGLAVEAICNATKVPMRHIQALEAGAFQELPGGVFRKGFVRSYLKALGLEEAAWMRRFEESCRESGLGDSNGTEWATFAENVRNSRGLARRRTHLRGAGWGAVLVLTTLAGWCGWRLATHRSMIPPAPLWRGLKSWVDNAPSR